MDWYRRAYEQGENQGAMYLGMAYRDAEGGLGDLEKADELLRPLAEGGNANAMREMALLEWRKTQGMREPEPVVACLEKACQWADKAKEAGDKRAEALLKTLKHAEILCVVQLPRGFCIAVCACLMVMVWSRTKRLPCACSKFLQTAATVQQQGVLGLCYAKGEHVQQDNEQARKWFERGVAHENPESMMNLAYMYVNGIGGQTDLKRAAELYEQAAKAGFAPAGFHLAQMYHTGQGVQKDLTKEFEWALKSAEAGHVPAQYHVGALYLNGEGVARNLVEAKSWIMQAAEGGSQPAKVMLSKIAELEAERDRKQREEAESEDPAE